MSCERDTAMKLHTILKSVTLSRKRGFGIIFILMKEFKINFIDNKSINEEKCAIRINANCCTNVWVINVHAPTEEKDDEVKDNFYDSLRRLFHSLPFNGYIVLGRIEVHFSEP